MAKTLDGHVPLHLAEREDRGEYRPPALPPTEGGFSALHCAAIAGEGNTYLWSSVDPTLPSPLPCYGPLTTALRRDCGLRLGCAAAARGVGGDWDAVVRVGGTRSADRLLAQGQLSTATCHA